MAATNTLIVFASRHGNVEKFARNIFNLIDGKVDICNLNNRESFPDASTYDSIIVGGSIYHGKIQEKVSKFCFHNIEILKNKRLGLFISCGYSGEKAEKELREAFPLELFAKAVASDYFGGKIDNSRLSFLERIIANQLSESGELTQSVSQEKIKNFAQKMNQSNVVEK